jgi:hypothetical protein
MKLQELKSLIREEIQSVLREFKDPKLIKGVDITIENVNEADNLGAFRRLVITTNKLDMIKSEIEDYIKRPNIKSDYADAKLSIKPGVKANVLVVDIEAVSGTALANKISDVVKKFDKTANIKVRKELKLKPIK